ncbi:hypothetical protein ccbrp13_11720 [Ktedonobacteria bacterium brp13]|nr:hypothetical protein ccbrp13_11720 [Ktedonobacteria bacterium brp13]
MWGNQGTKSRDVSSRGDQGTESGEPDPHIDMHGMARRSPDSGRGHSSHARHDIELHPLDLEKGLVRHEGNEGHYTDTDRSRRVSSEHSELTGRELYRYREVVGALRGIQEDIVNIRRRLDDRPDSTNQPDNTGNNRRTWKEWFTGRNGRSWKDWYNGPWNSHISTIGGVVAPLSVVSMIYMYRPDLLSKAVAELSRHSH